MATAGANMPLPGSTTVGVNSTTAITRRSGWRNQRQIQVVRRSHTIRQPKAAKA